MVGHVVFYANGPARLMRSCIIADAFYPNAERTLILLRQFGYDYDAILPRVRDEFSEIIELRQAARRYSHVDQFIGTYLSRFPQLRPAFRPDAHAVVFGFRSPVQKRIVREMKALGATVDIYAESIMMDRYLFPRKEHAAKRALRRLLADAFDYQHDYDRFFVRTPEIYAGSPWRDKLVEMPPLLALPSAARYADLLLDGLDLDELRRYDRVYFGQPISELFDDYSQADEEAMLRRMLGDEPVLVLPHPQERLGGENKYAALPGARVLPAGLPNDLICIRLKPTTTLTFASTIAIDYALANPGSVNLFHPLDRASRALLERFAPHVPNMRIADRPAGPAAGA